MLYCAKKDREGETMNVIIRNTAYLLSMYERANAGIPSIHGAFEAPVPQ